ncbi:restriction endonuclease subunit S [Glaciecola sp. SC05]|uniref:restriction endonuclease subunit S n=1 Tax=Glaciecola sp. SC05 TaxID=1987355 RepID=UPI0035274293
MTFASKKLHELAEVFSGYAFKSKDLGEEGLPVVKIKNVNDKIVSKQCDQFLPNNLVTERLKKYLLQKEDILVAMTGQGSLGRIGKMINQKGQYIVNQRVGIVRSKVEDDSVAEYLFSVLALDEFEQQLYSLGAGAGQPNVSAVDIGNLDIPYPDKSSRKFISKARANYDNLIENNNRRIAILEDMAQSLYREWFVNFRYPNHEDNLEADGKPKLIDSPLGQIPEGWEVKSAAEAITINPKTKLVKDGEKPFVGMSGLSEGSMVIGDIIEKTGNSGAKFINRDTLFARITPCLQNGKTGYVQFLTPEQPVGFGSTEFIVLRESEYLSSEFIYLLSRSNNFREHAIQSMTGATGRQRVHNDCFASCYLPVPPKELMKEFTELVKPMFKSIFNLSKRNENLKQQRDMLLPKLISGQIEL